MFRECILEGIQLSPTSVHNRGCKLKRSFFPVADLHNESGKPIPKAITLVHVLLFLFVGSAFVGSYICTIAKLGVMQRVEVTQWMKEQNKQLSNSLLTEGLTN